MGKQICRDYLGKISEMFYQFTDKLQRDCLGEKFEMFCQFIDKNDKNQKEEKLLNIQTT